MQESKQQLLAFRVYRARDPEAYRLLYSQYRQPIAKFLAVKLPRAEDVDELTAEVFLRGWEYMTSNRVESPKAFFRRIAQNLVTDFYRKSGRTEVLTDELAETLPEPSSLAEDVARREEAAALNKKLQQLRAEYRQVLVLKYFSEFSVLEIAEELGKTPNAIRVLLFRAIRALKKL